MRPKHYNIENGIYFITTRCARGIAAFNQVTACEAFLAVLREKRSAFGFSLLAYVLMPDHYHLIFQLPEQVTIWKLMNHINGATSHAINETAEERYAKVWQGGFHDVVIRKAQEFAVKVNYVHDNPVRRNLVSRAEDYRYSSSQFYCSQFGSPYLSTSGFDDFALMGILRAIKTVL
ncbi:MAG: transposase [Ignavibacteria bacterium]|nr:transposase [Ignavibacteria bacterium]